MSKNKPNLFVLGAAKCGTTSLSSYLDQHPDIFITEEKEPHFFDEDRLYKKGFKYYLNQHFIGTESYKIRGEATPSYIRFKKVPKRLKQEYQEEPPKFIIILRNPADRAWSHYLHMVRNGVETEDFSKALSLEKERLNGDSPIWWWGYKKDGFYAKQIKHWFSYFPKENFLFLLTEDLKSQPNREMQKVFNYLDVEPNIELNRLDKKNVASTNRSKLIAILVNRPNVLKTFIKKFLPYHWIKRTKELINLYNKTPLGNKKKPRLPTTKREQLITEYKSDILELENLIDRDLSHWLISGDSDEK